MLVNQDKLGAPSQDITGIGVIGVNALEPSEQ